MKFNALNQNHIKKLQTMVAQERFSTGESVLDLHAKDQSQHAPSRPEAVIWPVDRNEVAAILRYANEHRIPITGWGSGSSLEGNPIPIQKGIVLDFSQMNRILNIRAEDFQADVEPGVIYQDLNEKLRHTGLFFPPDPGARATVGGMIANNASGTRTVYYGSTKDYVLRLEVVLASGEIIEMGTRATKTSSGYDLIHLMVGSEGTLAVVTAATLRLVGFPVEYSAAIATFPSVEAASKAVFEIIRAGLNPAALELLGPECIELMNREEQLGLKVSPTLFVEFHSSSAGHLAEVLEMGQEICDDQGCTEFRSGLGKAERDRIFKARHALGEMIIRTHPDCGTLVVDVAVPNTAYPAIIAAIGEEMKATGIMGYTFGHAGDGNVHFNIPGKKGDQKQWAQIDRLVQRLVSKALDLGGTATGEHGVGLGKKKYMTAEHGKSLDWMKQIKNLFDPNGILNPGKIFP
ncbi:MAG: FAD-binding oxidoreductase [Deltaproteobacteria bacterium]|nr:FAD-binding oxidoreductase [Deltaproteobacteria bacterium]MBW2515280.1 FAD-binding oxidoreductase [Deltaproteobacteria bacterium]